MDIHYTSRGFKRGEFKDRFGEVCSIQESSLAGENCIWLGCEHETIDRFLANPCGARMHLTQEMAAALIPLLQHFVETGELPPPRTETAPEQPNAAETEER